jgi:hypothetical protein
MGDDSFKPHDIEAAREAAANAGVRAIKITRNGVTQKYIVDPRRPVYGVKPSVWATLRDVPDYENQKTMLRTVVEAAESVDLTVEDLVACKFLVRREPLDPIRALLEREEVLPLSSSKNQEETPCWDCGIWFSREGRPRCPCCEWQYCPECGACHRDCDYRSRLKQGELPPEAPF